MSEFVDKQRTSCALGGALAAISSLPDVIPIIHTAMGCGGNLMNSVSFGAGALGSSYCSGGTAPTSAVTETEIVFGGNDRLREQIASTLKLIEGKLYIVATGCMTEMIGDDTAGAASEFAEAGEPVITISTPSFKGDSYSGYEILLDGIFNRWLRKTGETDNKLINVFGVVPGYDPFFRGDLREIERIGEKLGIKVNTFFSPAQTFENITSAPNAALNVVFSRTRCRDFAEKFSDKYGVPYWITDLPIGPEATDAFVLGLAKRLNIDEAAAKRVINEENDLYYRYFERTVDFYADGELRHYAVTVTNSNYAVPLTKYLHRELGWIIADAFVTDNLTDAQKQSLTDGFSDLPVKPLFERNTFEISRLSIHNHPQNRGMRYFDSLSPLFIVGSAYEKPAAIKRGAKHLSVSFPANDRVIVTQGYAGYNGGLRLFEDLMGAFIAMKG